MQFQLCLINGSVLFVDPHAIYVLKLQLTITKSPVHEKLRTINQHHLYHYIMLFYLPTENQYSYSLNLPVSQIYSSDIINTVFNFQTLVLLNQFSSLSVYIQTILSIIYDRQLRQSYIYQPLGFEIPCFQANISYKFLVFEKVTLTETFWLLV